MLAASSHEPSGTDLRQVLDKRGSKNKGSRPHSPIRFDGGEPRDDDRSAHPAAASVAAVATPAVSDPNLRPLDDDPRSGQKRQHNVHKKGRNTESFDPVSTFVRPAMRVLTGSSRIARYPRQLKHDDILIVPELFCAEDDWKVYYDLVEEMRDIQDQGADKGSEWIPWHEGCHLVTKNPNSSPTFKRVVDKCCDYFGIEPKSLGLRFNWYRDDKDWKPFHHDSAAFNPDVGIGVVYCKTKQPPPSKKRQNVGRICAGACLYILCVLCVLYMCVCVCLRVCEPVCVCVPACYMHAMCLVCIHAPRTGHVQCI